MSYLLKKKKPVSRRGRITGNSGMREELLSSNPQYSTNVSNNQQFVIPFNCPDCIKKAKKILKKRFKVKRVNFDLIVTGNMKEVEELLAKKGFVS